MDTIRYIVLTASDAGSRGERADRSGDVIVEHMDGLGASCVERALLPDDQAALAGFLAAAADDGRADVILTTGGTGFTERDVTPEATASVIERPVPGIPEARRAEGLKKTPHAMLSRGVAGLRRHTLIVNLPGSPKAVQEGMELLVRVLPHAVETLRSATGVDCGRRFHVERRV